MAVCVPETSRSTETEWRQIRLGEVCHNRKELAEPASLPDAVYVGLEHLDPGNPRLRRFGRASEVRSAKARFYPSDVLYGKLRPYLKKAVLAEREGMCSTDILVLFSDVNELSPQYLSYVCHTNAFVEHAIRTTHGLNHPRTSWASLGTFETAIPGIREQRRIAGVLGTIQKAIEAQEKVIAAARELKRSLMRHLFTYGPVPVSEAARVPLKQTEIGPVPEQWTMVPLREVIVDGPQNGLYKPQSLYGSGTPIIRITDFPTEGAMINAAANRVQLSAEEAHAYAVQRGDILVNRVNSLPQLGKCALIKELREPTVFESNMMRFRTDAERVVAEFVFHFLCLPDVRESLRGRSKRAVAQSSIAQGDVESVPIPLPSIHTQQQVVHALAATQTKLQAEEVAARSLSALFTSALHHLMTGKIRVPETLEV